MQILNIRHATIYRGQQQVFNDLNLTIDEGQNTAIIGPNGAGKTTLMKAISRELYPRLGSDGVLELFGKSTWNVWELRNRLGLVSLDLQQNFSRQTVGAGVVRSGFYSSLANFQHQTFTPKQLAVCDARMSELGIAHLSDKPFAKMSTGEQRRCLLARALVNDPEALVLDEPTTGLDLPAMFGYLQTVDRLIEAGKTVVLVTHHIHEIVPAINHVVLLKAGQVFAEGDKQSVLTCDNLSELFGVPIKVICEDGYYRALPG